MKFLKLIFHCFLIICLTVITQIGGLIYLLSIIIFKKKRRKKYLYFIVIYLVFSIVIIPIIAPLFGREKIKNTEIIQAHNFFYILTNRNYVNPELNNTLEEIASCFKEEYPNIKIKYLDANFPFINKFPLLPHLSHNDGKKLDLCLLYSENEKLTNKKPSLSGYGVYEYPNKNETNQTGACKQKGYWQYDFPKYLRLWKTNEEIKFSSQGTKYLINCIATDNSIGKIFIEPHLKQRLNLNSSKVRYHGCQAVRHDDHIHIQLK